MLRIVVATCRVGGMSRDDKGRPTGGSRCGSGTHPARRARASGGDPCVWAQGLGLCAGHLPVLAGALPAGAVGSVVRVDPGVQLARDRPGHVHRRSADHGDDHGDGGPTDGHQPPRRDGIRLLRRGLRAGPVHVAALVGADRVRHSGPDVLVPLPAALRAEGAGRQLGQASISTNTISAGGRRESLRLPARLSPAFFTF